MPYGVSTPRFACFCVAACLSCVAGAQLVHVSYQPLADLDELVEESMRQKKKSKNKNL